MYYSLNITQYLNNVGITSYSNRKLGAFTVNNASLPLLKNYVNNTFHVQNIPLFIKKKRVHEGYEDNISCENQTITVNFDKKIAKVYFVIAANNGDYNSEICIINNFSETITRSLYVPDAIQSSQLSKNVKDILTFGSINTKFSKEPITYISSYLYIQEIDVDSSIKYIILPYNPDIHIFAITMEVQQNE